MGFYALFQGRVYLAERDDAGNPIGARAVGNVSSLSLSLETDVIEHVESMSGQRVVDLRLVKQKSANISLTIEEFTRENLALALYGKYFTTGTGTVTNEIVGGTSPAVGVRYFLSYQKVTDLVIVDSASPASTLSEGTHYIADEDFGAIQFLNIAGFTPPFKANYTYNPVDRVGIFSQPPPERFLRFEGINTAANNSKVLVELYRVVFDPLKRLDIITDDLSKIELEGRLLVDPTKPVSAVLGQFGRIMQIG